jgi:uncharacterized membrane protein YeaQ/YmgE (transglycosylase-associated protein family)
LVVSLATLDKGVALPEQSAGIVRLDAARRPAFNWGGQGQEERKMLNWILIIIVGGILGWLASIVMRTDAQQGILLNIVVGIVGAILGGLLLAPMLGGGSITSGDFSLPNLLISLLGAIILLAVINLVRRGSVR